MNALAERPPIRQAPDLTMRVRSEYLEMPGLRLTTAQAQRLWNLDRQQCDAVFAVLIEAGIIKRMPDGSFALA
jgi:hypothetical protein